MPRYGSFQILPGCTASSIITGRGLPSSRRPCRFPPVGHPPLGPGRAPGEARSPGGARGRLGGKVQASPRTSGLEGENPAGLPDLQGGIHPQAHRARHPSHARPCPGRDGMDLRGHPCLEKGGPGPFQGLGEGSSPGRRQGDHLAGEGLARRGGPPHLPVILF